jgi:2-keto-4-pentenoate hydratase
MGRFAARSEKGTATARRLVAARRASLALDGYPGPIPSSLEEAYGCQNAAIDLWGDELVGWKVGRVSAEQEPILGAGRLLGAIFRRGLHAASKTDEVSFPVIVGGFAAVEGEYVYRVAKDALPDKVLWTPQEALEFVDALFIAVECAGSPIPEINDFGAAVVASDFGNNNGLILGDSISDWRALAPSDLVCETEIDGKVVGRGAASDLPGGPAAALAFTFSTCAHLGRPLRAGMLVSSGAVTGVHEIEVGQHAFVKFGAFGAIRCKAVAAVAEQTSGQGVSP